MDRSAFILRVIVERLDRVERKLDVLLKGTAAMSTELDALAAQVSANTALEASAVQLIEGLAAQLAAAATDPTKVQALADQLKTSAASLSAAIVANTPAAPPAPAPTPSP